MPIDYEIDPQRKRVHVSVHGSVSVGEVQELVRAIARDSRLRGGFGILSDHRRLDRTLSTEALHQVAEVLEEQLDAFRTARWAAVVARPSSYGNMRMLAARASMLGAEMQIRVFTDLDHAVGWLDATDADTPAAR